MALTNARAHDTASAMVDICMVVDNDARRDPRVQKEARTLVSKGYSVRVVARTHDPADTALEHTPDGYGVQRVFVQLQGVTWRERTKARVRRLAPGVYEPVTEKYRQLRGIEPQPTVQAPSTPGRVGPTNEHAAYLRSLEYMPQVQRAFAEAIVRARPSAVHAHDLDTLQGAHWAASVTGAALVYDSHEIWWQQHAEGQVPDAWIAYYRALESRLIRDCDAVLTVCDSIADFLARTHDVPLPTVVRNALEPPKEGWIQALHPSQSPVTVLFHGGFAPHRGLEEVLASVSRWTHAQLVFRGFGSGQADLERIVRENGLTDRVRFDSPVPMSDVVRAASTADIGIIPYKPVCLNNRFSTPNKLFEYLSAGLAIAASDLPEIRRVIDQERVGGVFDPDDPDTIAETIRRLSEDPAELFAMRQRALEAARHRHNWTIEAEKLSGLYARLLPRSLRGRGKRILGSLTRVIQGG